MSNLTRSVAIAIIISLALGAIVGRALVRAGQVNQLPPAVPAKTVEAERFILKNPQGKMMAILDLNPDGVPVLAMFDKDGKSRAQISISPGADGQPFISLSDKNGKAIFYAPSK
ncbi:MAG TPA: hypothetical protein VH370_11665 [Humisphaera sp.]|nr:hypothetical protein [Humisphaera sp.]